MNATLGHCIVISNNSTMNKARGQYVLVVLFPPSQCKFVTRKLKLIMTASSTINPQNIHQAQG
jgi:hypothetical protein